MNENNDSEHNQPLSKEDITILMRRFKSKNTKPELIVRHYLASNGFRGYRLHYKKIPGSPDICFVGKKIAIFIQGCFWHGHIGCNISHIPKVNSEYWEKKITDNIARDKRNVEQLTAKGWRIITIYECELQPKQIQRILLNLLLDIHRLLGNDTR